LRIRLCCCFHTSGLALDVLFKNLEVLILTLSFQAN
jgi:hypothetical protein